MANAPVSGGTDGLAEAAGPSSTGTLPMTHLQRAGHESYPATSMTHHPCLAR